MNTGAIPAMSMNLSLTNVQQSAHFSILKKAMQTQINAMEGLYNEQPVNNLKGSDLISSAKPPSGHLIDTHA